MKFSAKTLAHYRQAAITNNIDWYCSEAQSWELSYERSAQHWQSTHKMPPYHSNLIVAGIDPRPAIDSINRAGLSKWTIKDAYASLDLTQQNFAVLFDAYWYLRPAGPWTKPLPDNPEVHRVSTAAELQRWVAAWGETPAGTTIFVPKLLDDSDIALLYVETNGGIVAGLCTNKSRSAVGVTNVFGTAEHLNACYAYITKQYPTLAIVGYDGETEVERLCEVGAINLGKLTIWQQQA